MPILSKNKNLADFLENGGVFRFGNFFASGDKIFSYDILIAKVDRSNREILLASEKSTATTTRHKNQIRSAALSCFSEPDEHGLSESWEVIPVVNSSLLS